MRHVLAHSLTKVSLAGGNNDRIGCDLICIALGRYLVCLVTQDSLGSAGLCLTYDSPPCTRGRSLAEEKN